MVSETFDHTSVIQFLEKRFNVEVPNISKWRRSITGDLTSFFNFDQQPDYSWPDLPPTTDYRKNAAEDCKLPYPQVPELQSMPEQEPGTRVSRALGYTFIVSDKLQLETDTLTLSVTLTNLGESGAAFSLFDVRDLRLTQAVRQYAVEGGNHTVVASLPITDKSSYDYLLLGPNGFVRHFTGESAIDCKDVQVHVTYDENDKSIIVHLVNGNSASSVTFELYDNIYSSYYNFTAGGTTYSVVAAPDSIAQTAFAISAAGNWYDFKVSVDNCLTRRFAGRIETGEDSISDPAMGFKSSVKQQLHPTLPEKYRSLSKATGENLTLAGHKDALWNFGNEIEL